MTPRSGRSKTLGRWPLLVVFLLLAAGVVIGGDLYYRSYERQYRVAVEHQLAAIADLKVSELATWRKERISDGSVLFQNPAFSVLLRRILDTPGDAATERQLQMWIEKLRKNYGYDRVRLLDTHGATRLSSPVGLDPVGADILTRASEVLRSGQIAFQDFYRNERDQRIYLAVLIPILDDTDAGRPLGTLVLRVDPETYLYPFIERWPTPSATAETLLVRREGNEVVFLNPLRFQTNTALALREPLTRADLPAVQAVLGREGAMQGVDYRGVPVLAVTRVIPDSPWSLVARIDAAEVDAPLRARRWELMVLVSTLVGGAAAAIAFIWRQEQVRFYRERAGSAEALRASEARLQFALEEAETGAWEMDLMDHSAHRSLKHDQIFGYQTLLPQWTFEIFLEHVVPEDRARVDQAFRQAVSSQGDWRFECRIIRVDGQQRWILASGRHRADPGGQPRLMAGIIQDITERKRVEQEVRTLNVELEHRVQLRTADLKAANEELEAFSYSVSHDLRAPVRAINGFSRILVEDCGDRLDAENRRVLGIISSEARRMGQLIDDLLGFSRLGRQKLESADIDMTALATSVFEEQAAQAPTRNLQLALSPLAPARGDWAMMRIVWTNLVANAIKFTAHTDPAVIDIASREEDGHTVYSVKDNGVGFDMTYAPKLFGVFQRLHSSDEFEGNGVGLALVHRIIQRHQGRVWAEGKVNDGATFSFALPRVKEEP